MSVGQENACWHQNFEGGFGDYGLIYQTASNQQNSVRNLNL